MSVPFLVGIDVGSRELTVATFQPSGGISVQTFINEAAGHRKLSRFLLGHERPCRVCLEATGIYNIDVSLALHRTPGVEVMIANPRAVHNFARAILARGKDDPLDAVVLVEYAKRMPFVRWIPPSLEAMRLRTLARRLWALSKACTMERNRLHAIRSSREFHDIIEDDVLDHIEHLKARHERIVQRALEHIASDPQLQRSFDLLTSIKGIAERSAIQILGEVCVLPEDMDKRQWVAHAGLDPRPHRSGISIFKNARISKTGNSYLRRALYMPAMVAARHEPSVKAYAEHLASRGKKPKVIYVAIMRKLLHAIFAMLRHDAPFDGARFFRQPD